MNNQYSNILEALKDLKLKGYTQSFSLTKDGLYCPLKDKTFTPSDIHIVEYHRFEGDTDPDDMAILYAIETTTNCKGVVIDAYGTYANSELGEFFNQVKHT